MEYTVDSMRGLFEDGESKPCDGGRNRVDYAEALRRGRESIDTVVLELRPVMISSRRNGDHETEKMVADMIVRRLESLLDVPGLELQAASLLRDMDLISSDIDGRRSLALKVLSATVRGGTRRIVSRLSALAS